MSAVDVPRGTGIHLPEYDEWTGTPEWRAHLLEHGAVTGAPQEGCPGCAVRPLLAEVANVWFDTGLNRRGIMEAIWSESDGYGEPGLIPDQGYDWSGIRDSSPAAVKRMYDIATGAAS